ncbi:sugar phosphate isomerase/epimerase family protein [Microlunatus soli]|uniref:Sugar phosphate isomerase/epimerase n=1 Tax=Microlunatus soli TaxID=630515 RepID=A0A1H1M5M6_9ACTN|nr:sugar phosphate isomerase/epimerase family protein [Microlunatus soli]SDR82046.1 Sugar phosphate isomerase/epimerase [Microlunatus soli]
MTDKITFGFSSYSFHSKLSTGEMTLPDVIDWVADSEGEHLELAVVGSNGTDGPIPSLDSDPGYVDSIAKKADQAGVILSNIAIGANFFTSDPAEIEAEVKRVKAYLDLAEQLGIKLMRHDVVAHSGLQGDDTPLFEEALPNIVGAAKEIAQYAAGKGITTSLENHGFFVQAADRVRRIIHAVDEPNFKTTLDVGNFVCVDEDPTVSVPQNLPYAMIVHFKDFYIRPADRDPGEGWFRSRGGKYLRGAVVGNGDIDLWSVARSIKESDYSGFASIEFEGHEDCLLGCARGIANAKRLIAQA